VAAFGLPVGGILLFAFVVRVYLAIFYPEQLVPSKTDADPGESSRLERVLLRISRYNIFIIGFLILIAILAYWVVPNVIVYVGRVSVDTLIRYKWFFMATAAVMLGLTIWVIYLRYLLARRSIDRQTELEKHRLELEYKHGSGKSAHGRIGHDGSVDLVTWEGEIVPQTGKRARRKEPPDATLNS
jgi:hypothetical protein